jgi:hypothetical protein
MSSKPHNHADERTPLINGGAGSSGSDNDATIENGGSKAWAFFLDSSRTPGQDSDSFAVRSLVYCWHITKVTVLSSTTSAHTLAVLPC